MHFITVQMVPSSPCDLISGATGRSDPENNTSRRDATSQTFGETLHGNDQHCGQSTGR